MEIYKEIQDYFKSKNISQIAIAETLGVTKAYVNALLNGRQRFGKKQAEIWSEKFGFSKSWLLTGEGAMLRDEQANNARMVGRVWPAAQFDEGVIMVSFVPATATASFVESLADGEAPELDSIPVIPTGNERRDADQLRVFEVEGESMFPTIPSGSLILAKEIPEKSWHYAEGVVVAVYGEMVTVKRVARNNLLTDNYIILRSDNEAYGEMRVALADLRGLYKAKRIISSPIF